MKRGKLLQPRVAALFEPFPRAHGVSWWKPDGERRGQSKRPGWKKTEESMHGQWVVVENECSDPLKRFLAAPSGAR